MGDRLLGVADDGLAELLESCSHGVETASGGQVKHGEADSEVQKSKNTGPLWESK